MPELIRNMRTTLFNEFNNICSKGLKMFGRTHQEKGSKVCEKECELSTSEEITFRFNEMKATHAASFFLKLNGGSMNSIKLIRLMYLADRISLDRFERPISTDTYINIVCGPALSNILNIIGGSKEGVDWHKHISKPDKYDVVRLNTVPNFDELSKRAKSTMTEIFNEYNGKNEICLDDFEESKNTSINSIIKVEDIFKALGKQEAEIETISDELQSLRFVFSQN